MSKRGKIDELLEMSFYGHLDQVKILVKEGVNVNGIGGNSMTPLFAALGGENYDIIQFLVNQGADINQGGWTLLHEAIDLAIDGMIQEETERPDANLLQIIKFLIDKGADLNKRDTKGNSPLDSIKSYAGDSKSFIKLKTFFRPIIPDIDGRLGEEYL